MNASGDRQGPMLVKTVKAVCNGCMYLERSRDRFGCQHKTVKADEVDSRMIWVGTGMCPTPTWCPFTGKIEVQRG